MRQELYVAVMSDVARNVISVVDIVIYTESDTVVASLMEFIDSDKLSHSY